MRLPKLGRRWWLAALFCLMLVAAIATTTWATEQLADAATTKKVIGVWTTAASGSGDKARIWWFEKDGTFSSWIEDATGKYQPSEHGRWWVSEQRMSREHIIPPSGGSGGPGPGYRFEQMTVVRAEGGELVLTGWDGQTLHLKRR